tara:strand:+ start:208882 stop:209073 length:192 start_codon:yes stop_codon:yes gene_type:complete
MVRTEDGERGIGNVEQGPVWQAEGIGALDIMLNEACGDAAGRAVWPEVDDLVRLPFKIDDQGV